MDVSELSVYVHVPLCPARCNYCDFYSETVTPARRGPLSDALLDAILAESAAWFDSERVSTVYIGGGSPTYIGPERLQRLLDGLAHRLVTSATLEWSVECHPAELTPEIVCVLEESEANRLSIGVQSFEAETLELIGRRDAAASDPERISAALSGWSGELSVDLIGERPGQSAAGFRHDLETAIALGARHVSVYPLSWPDGDSDPRERLGYPEFDAWAVAEEVLGDAGLARYEVSNFARPGFECRHSLAYWRMAPYVGIGPGAVGTLPVPAENRRPEAWTVRTTGLEPAAAFINADKRPAVTRELQTKSEALFEKLMMGLRLSEGISLDAIGEEFGDGARSSILTAIRPYREDGLLEDTREAVAGDRRIRCLPDGRLRLDEILRGFMDIIE